MTKQQPAKVINSLRIASPCNAAWNDMEGDDRKRFCSICKTNVYNTSEMTERQIIDLIEAAEGGHPPCMRLYRRKDGTVLTSNCPVGLKRVRRRLALAASFIIGIFGLSAFGWYRSQTNGGMIMGEMVVPENHILGKIAVPQALMGEVEASHE